MTERLRLRGRQMVQTDNHVLCGHRHRAAIRRLEDVVRGKHEHARFGLRFGRKREVHSHLVTVEVRVEGATHERVQVDGLAFNELRLERLDTEAVKRRCTVQQHRMLGDDLFEDVPHLGARTLNHALGGLHVLREREIHETLHDERLEQLERHALRKTTLVEVKLRTVHDDRTARVVHALTEQVRTEAALLALKHVGERLERAVAGARDRAATAAVIEQRIHRLLKHALFVVHDDLGGAEINEALEAVVAVDHTAVQVVEIGRREAAAVELDHGAKIRRNHRDAIEHHARG